MRLLQKVFDAARSRYTLVSAFVITFILVAMFRLFDLQIINGIRYVQSASGENRETRRVTEYAPRGRIMDRNGILIASNYEINTVHIVRTPAFSADNGADFGAGDDVLNRVLLDVCAILERNGDTWLRSIEQYYIFDQNTKTPVFVRENIEDSREWQKNILRLSDTAITEDPYELLIYLCSDRAYGIDDMYTDEEAYRIIAMRYLIETGQGAFDAGASILLARDIKQAAIAELLENSHSLSGVTVRSEPVREYHDAEYISHVLGYMNSITKEQYDVLKDAGYGDKDIVGQYGIESQAEAYLHGRDGEKRVELFENGLSDSAIDGRPAIPGSDVVLTIDMNLQKAAMESLEKNIAIIKEAQFNGYVRTDSKVNFMDAEAGAAVAVDVKSGEVLAMVSLPTFDPSIFLAPSSDADAQAAKTELFNDPLNISWNRAISGTYAPGSTFKPITAITALQEGIIQPHTQINDPGTITLGERRLFCLEGGHGWLDLKRALETSCNVFFYQIGVDSTVDNLEKWAKQFGLGVKTGIDLPYEQAGIMSSRAYKQEEFDDIWRPADTAQVSIGQLYNRFTPLQMACYMSSFANGGQYFKPRVMQKIIRYDGSIVHEAQPEVRKIPVDPQNIEAIKDGMIASTTEIDGTATMVFQDFPFSVAGKTGTAETGNEDEQTKSSNALFVCYAPAHDPKIAVVVVIEKGVWGSYAAPVARDILEVYFGLNEQRVVEDDTVYDTNSAVIY